MRGEHEAEALDMAPDKGSSPLARGAPLADGGEQLGLGIIPACAGSTLPRDLVIQPEEDHPRLRGEHLKEPSELASEMGSSPLARGALLEKVKV